MTLADRLSTYRTHPHTTISDPRWESLLTDLRGGRIGIDRQTGKRGAIIVVNEVGS